MALRLPKHYRQPTHQRHHNQQTDEKGNPMTPPKTENLKISFQRGWLNQGCVRGEGSIQLDGTSMTIDGEWAGISWSKQARVIKYREMMKLQRTKDGFSIRLRDIGPGIAGKQWIHAAFPPGEQSSAAAITNWLKQKREYPECWVCHAEIDLETKKCVSCGRPFSQGVRKRGVQLLIGSAIGLAVGIPLAWQNPIGWGVVIVLISGVVFVIGLLNVASGKGMRG